jgi:hypothetical protein
MVLMNPGHGVKDLMWIDAPLGPPPCLLDQRGIPEKGTKLFRAVVAANETRQPPQADAIPSGQDDTPAALGDVRSWRQVASYVFAEKRLVIGFRHFVLR